MKNYSIFKSVLEFIHGFLVFFATISFAISCCIALFVVKLSESLNITLTESNIGDAAKLTFINVAVLSLIFTIADLIRRKITVERPLNSITKAAEKIMDGDFSVNIKQPYKFGTDDAFVRVIECFNKMTKELGSVETLRSDFIADISHEIKTPLAIMQNYGVLLQTPNISDEQRIKYAKGIADASQRLANMITNILKLNRLENQQIYPQNVKFDLSEQLCNCLLQYENVWEDSKIQLVTDIADNIKITGDSELLSLVWNNLFSNAFKFTPQGGTVSVALSICGKYAVVKITDTGCGMTPEVGAHIFEKFYRGENSVGTYGNGLGLALVKRIIDITGSEIDVESKIGAGSSFTVKLLAKPVE